MQTSTTEGQNDPSKTPSPQATPPAESKVVPPTKEAGSDVDEFGYKKIASAPDSKTKETPSGEQKAGEKKVEEEVEIKEPVAGYGKDPLKVEPPKETPPPPADLKAELGFDLDVKDMDQTDVDKIKKFVKDSKLGEEAAKAFVQLKKEEIQADRQAIADFEKNQKQKIDQQRAAWDKELREDPDFGGSKFAKNLHNINKLLEQHMPETKKMLTDRGSMLPPLVMRDLSKLADKIFATDKLIQGDVTKPAETVVEEKKNPWDYLYN